MRNRLGSWEYGVGLLQDGPNPHYSPSPNGKIEAGGIDQKMLLSYGRIFLVTFSKPVQRKSAEDIPVATSECGAM